MPLDWPPRRDPVPRSRPEPPRRPAGRAGAELAPTRPDQDSLHDEGLDPLTWPWPDRHPQGVEPDVLDWPSPAARRGFWGVACRVTVGCQWHLADPVDLFGPAAA